MPLLLSASRRCRAFFFFFFNDTATTEIYTLSLHDALPICRCPRTSRPNATFSSRCCRTRRRSSRSRSEEHTSELQSPDHLVCRLLLEKKKNLRNFSCKSPSRRPFPIYPSLHTFYTLCTPRS